MVYIIKLNSIVIASIRINFWGKSIIYLIKAQVVIKYINHIITDIIKLIFSQNKSNHDCTWKYIFSTVLKVSWCSVLRYCIIAYTSGVTMTVQSFLVSLGWIVLFEFWPPLFIVKAWINKCSGHQNWVSKQKLQWWSFWWVSGVKYF